VVDNHNTAAAYGSGSVDVFATPAMVALMENAARHAVAEHLPEGSSTVGTAINIVHTRATPVGNDVSATATLKSVDGRMLVFEVVATDTHGEIGRGSHTRFVIDVERFMGKLQK
jgi:predicted thioesterase